MNMKNVMNKSCYLICVLLTALLLTGCSSRSVYYQLLTSDEIEGFPVIESAGQLAEDDIGNMQIVAEDNKAVLYYNPNTTEIAVERKDTGELWYSNPQDRLSSTDSLINAQIIVTTLDKRDTAKRWDNIQ